MVVAGVVTPSSDPFSMSAMAVPLYVFYELSILVGRLVQRRSKMGRTAVCATRHRPIRLPVDEVTERRSDAPPQG